MATLRPVSTAPVKGRVCSGSENSRSTGTSCQATRTAELPVATWAPSTTWISVASPVRWKRPGSDSTTNETSPAPRVISVGTLAFQAPVATITSPVMVQMTMVSMNGSTSATTPSETGSSVLAAAWAMGAEPWPASLENSPRLTPQTAVSTNTPAPAPAMLAVGLNASRKIRVNAGRTRS